MSFVEQVANILRQRLPPRWELTVQPALGEPDKFDFAFLASSNGSHGAVMVELKSSFAPRDVATLTGGLVRRLRGRAGSTPLILAAPYLSARTRQLLVANEVSYIDLTGNIRVALDHPALFVEAVGADRDPNASPRAANALRGAKLGAVVRVLVDARPPFAVKQIAAKAGVNDGYVSRILDTLSDEALAERGRAGRVVDVDWPSLLRRRAAALSLFRPTGVFSYVARAGLPELMDDLAALPEAGRPVITGSFAAALRAPVAGSTTLVLYSMNPRKLADALPLLPVDAGADVVIIRPENSVAMSRPVRQGGLDYAQPSQVVIDCLSGNGRMPSEGEALLAWMEADETRWRAASIDDLPGDPAMG